MKLVEYGKHKISYPEKWEELTPKQLIKCLNILECNHFSHAQTEIMYYLSNWRFKTILVQLRRKAVSDDNAALELSALRQVFDFMKDRPSFKTWKFPTLKINGLTWLGPIDLFENLTIGEFGRAEDYFKAYMKDTDNQQMLCKFLACLYQPKKYWLIGKRQKFTEEFIAKNFASFKKIPLGTKKAILLNFAATRENLFSRFKNGFSKSEEKDELQKYGWTGTINLFCTRNNIVPKEFRERNILDVLILLDSLAIEAKQREKKKNDN